MTIWVVFVGMTVLAVLAVLWPLSRHRQAGAAGDADRQFYADQIAEIERDLGRGLLSPAEAEAAKAEAGRRLLRASAAVDPVAGSVGEPALRRRRAVSGLALSLVPIMALAVYGLFGSPELPAQPLSGRHRAAGGQLDLAAAVQEIESHLQKQPNDGRGWEVLAPVYLRIGRLDDAVRAYEAALRLLGPDPGRLTAYGEALVLSRDGVVPAEARTAFEQALQADGRLAKARFYLARAAEQDGDRARAKAEYNAILTGSPADAPWLPVVRDHLVRLDEPQPAAPGRDIIAGMVEGLAARLDREGGSADEWSRLLRSYAVLGEHGKAEAAFAKARKALAGDEAGLAALDAMARDLKLSATAP
jgi:cytochrome c-type biogenesis protein CcmH